MNIKITYNISGIIKNKLKQNKGELNIPPDTTVEYFLTRIAGINKKYIKYLDVTVNNKKIKLEEKLKNNSHIQILMPIGGG